MDRATVRALKRALGCETFAELKTSSRRFQCGEFDAATYHAYAGAVIDGRPDLVRSLYDSLPDERLRDACLAMHATSSGGGFVDARGDGGGSGSGSARGGSTATSTATTATATRASTSAEVLAPGLVCLRRALDLDAQAWLADVAFDVGESKASDGDDDAAAAETRQGFYDAIPGENPGEASVLRLNQGTRGRVVLPMDAFPSRLREIVLECVRAAQAADSKRNVPDMRPTTALVNFYKEGARFKWHRDSEDPEVARVDAGPPIVSFTVGLSADFAYKRRFEDETHDVVRLNSGDVLLFGGPARMIVHSVTRVVPRTMPPMLRGRMLHGRLNVTVRDIGRGVIDASKFPAYRVTYGGVDSSDHV